MTCSVGWLPRGRVWSLSEGYFSVEHSAVKGHASTLQEAVGNFEKHKQEFESAMNDLNGRIEGGAKQALAQLSTQWTEAAAKVNDALGQLGGRVDEAASSYQQGESEQADYVQQEGGKMDFHRADVNL